MSDIRSLLKGVKLIETMENYGLIHKTTVPQQNVEFDQEFEFFSDQEFWKKISKNPLENRGHKFNLNYFVVSDWVARVPGLYWSPSSEIMRQHTNADIAIESKKWVEFYPPGKSKKVLGGIGTLLLPPSDDGKVLMSVSAGCNASAGIPVLFYPEVIEELNIKQGDAVIIKDAKWQSMSKQWASNFASTKDIPRGYLVIDTVQKIEVLESDYPVVYHPFSLMEYNYQDSLMYDFVYATADSKVNNVDIEIEHFFDKYAKKDGRNGEYLLNPNIVNPIFDSRYTTPSELSHPSQKAKLNLLYERIRGTSFKDREIEELIIKLPQYYQSSVSIRTLAKNIGFNVIFLAEDSAVSMSAQLINRSIEIGLIENLIDRIVFEYPQIFK